MSLARFAITRGRETLVAGLLRRNWPRLATITPHQRLAYTTGALICDRLGRVGPGWLTAALADPDVTGRALALLAVIRHEQDDNSP